MLRASVNCPERPKENLEFPCIAQSKSTGLVLLFTAINEGIVLKPGSSCYHVGERSTAWVDADSPRWTLFTKGDSITLTVV